MKPKIFLVVLTLLMSCGCGPTRLERTASRLAPGMDKSQVRQLFAHFVLWEDKTNGIYAVQAATKFYSTNKQCASMIVYRHKNILTPGECSVYFDTNDDLIAHYYAE